MRGGDLRRQKTVVGGLGRQFPDGRQADVDGGSGKAAVFERSAVFLDEGLAEGAAGRGRVPGEELVQGEAVGAARMHGGNGIDHQFPQRLPAGQVGAGTTPVRSPGALGRGGRDRKLQLEGNVRMLFAPEFHQGIGKPAAVGPQAMDDGVAGGADGDQPGGVVDARPAVMDHALVPCPAPRHCCPSRSKTVSRWPATAGGLFLQKSDGWKNRIGAIIAGDKEDYH